MRESLNGPERIFKFVVGPILNFARETDVKAIKFNIYQELLILVAVIALAFPPVIEAFIRLFQPDAHIDVPLKDLFIWFIWFGVFCVLLIAYLDEPVRRRTRRRSVDDPQDRP